MLKMAGGRMRTFIIAQAKDVDVAQLACTSGTNARLLEAQGNAFGLWLLENGSTSFLKGLQEVLHEAEIDKKIGLGY
jgi:poly-gamma-glutamate capsule biosynthesis protein CapA/YwtB (metallophosphatase superfamily)